MSVLKTLKNVFYLPILVDSALGEQMKKALLGGEAKELVDPYCVFSFAGKEVSVMRFFNTSIILMNIQLKIKKKKTVIIFLFVKGAILVSEWKALLEFLPFCVEEEEEFEAFT